MSLARSTSQRREKGSVAVKYRTIVLLGLPGAGKGTQGKVLGAVPGFCYLGFGDVLRSLDPESEMGRRVFDYMARGELAPDDLVVSIWREYMERQIASGQFNPSHEMLVLDGIPRSVGQAEALAPHIEIAAILYLTCRDESALIDRIQHRAREQNRLDDTDRSVIEHRLEVYRESTAPVLNHYSPDLINEIDSLQHPLRVLDDIIHVLLHLPGQG